MRSRVYSTVLLGLVFASPAAAQSGGDRLQIHGYMSQALVQSSELPVYGIPTETTADYRNAALLFRYVATDDDAVVMMLGHRRLGNSVLTRSADEVGLRWAFYQRRLGDFSVRVGRVPMPGGIFNETRDVGTLHPFYRAPANFYLEGIETIDGGVLSHYLDAGSWQIESSLAGGGFGIKFPTTTPEGPFLIEARVEGAVGGQVWVYTPLTGVRVGASAMRWNPEEGEEMTPHTWNVSAEGARDRAALRGEYRRVLLDGMTMQNYYGQASVRAVGGLHVNAQADISKQEVETPIGVMKFTASRDVALGLSYKLSSSLVFKVEGHDVEGSAFDVFVNPMEPASTRYYVTSVAVTF